MQVRLANVLLCANYLALNTCTYLRLRLPHHPYYFLLRVLYLLFVEQFVEGFSLEELHCSEDGAEHVATEPHGIVYFISVDDPQEDEVGVDLIDFTSYFAKDIGHNT